MPNSAVTKEKEITTDGTEADVETVSNLVRLRVKQVSRDITERCRRVEPDDTNPESPCLTDDDTSPTN